MKIKQLVLMFSLFLISALSVMGQGIAIADFRCAENDLTANTFGTMVYDQNGEKCALIKIETTKQGFTFDAGMLGIVKTEEKPGEIWVYVPDRVKRLTISHKEYGILRDQDLGMSVQKGRTYILKLVVGESDNAERPGISYATMMSETDPLYPRWIEGSFQKGYWTGISLPTIDRVEARKSAIMNALLHYVLHEGVGNLKVGCQTNLESRESAQKYSVNTSWNEQAYITLSGYVVEVVNEYYNVRGEYVVLCRIGQQADGKNKLMISRFIQDQGEKGGVIFAARMENQGADYMLEYSYTYEPNGGICQVKTGKEEYEAEAMYYPQMGEKVPVRFGGVFQLAQIAASPIVASSYQLKTSMMMMESDGTQDMRDNASFIAEGVMLPYQIEFDLDRTLQMKTSMGDVKSGVFPTDVVEIMGFSNFASIISHRPQGLAKLSAFYNTLKNAVHLYPVQVNSVISSSDNMRDMNTNSNSSITISDYGIEWFSENSEETPSSNKNKTRKKGKPEVVPVMSEVVLKVKTPQ